MKRVFSLSQTSLKHWQKGFWFSHFRCPKVSVMVQWKAVGKSLTDHSSGHTLLAEIPQNDRVGCTIRASYVLTSPIPSAVSDPWGSSRILLARKSRWYVSLESKRSEVSQDWEQKKHKRRAKAFGQLWAEEGERLQIKARREWGGMRQVGKGRAEKAKELARKNDPRHRLISITSHLQNPFGIGNHFSTSLLPACMHNSTN